MRFVRTLLAAVLSLSFLSVAAVAQQRTSGEARDNVFSFSPAPFNAAVAPQMGPQGGYTPPVTPPPPSYNGEWVYTYTPEILPLPGNGFAWFKYVLTCINGNCDPNEGAGLAAWCAVDGWGYYSGSNSAFCPRRAIYG